MSARIAGGKAYANEKGQRKKREGRGVIIPGKGRGVTGIKLFCSSRREGGKGV